MSDKPENDKPEDGTVILSVPPPELRRPAPAGPAAAGEPEAPAEAGRDIPAPPTIRPREGAAAPAAPTSAPAPSSPPASPPPAAPPSQAPAAASPPKPPAPPAGPDDDEDGDATQVLVRKEPPHESTVMISVPPPSLGAKTPPAASPPSSSQTTAAPTAPSVAAAKPAAPQRADATPAASAAPRPAAPAASAPAAAPRPAAPPAGNRPEVDPSDRTVVIRPPDAETVNWSAPEPAWISLEHVIPSDHAGVHRLDKKVSSIGRALECDLRLYSASASRQHASIEQRENDWVLVPMEGRRVLVDGELIDAEVVLQPGMRLGLGDDELVVLDQEEPTAVEDEPKPILRAGVIALVTLGSGVALYLALSLLGFF